MIDREEIIAYLIAGYKQDLNKMSDTDLAFLFKEQKKLEAMSDKQLLELGKAIQRLV